MAEEKAQLLLEIVSRGTSRTGQDLQMLGGVASRTQQTWQGLNNQVSLTDRLQTRLTATNRASLWGWGLLSVGLAAWVRQGMAGTAEAQRLSHSLTVISRSIANIFAPWIQRAVGWVSDLAAKFHALTGAQQAQVRQWVALGGAISGTLVLLPRLIAGLNATSAAFTMMGLARAGALAGPIGLGIAAGVGIMAASPAGRDALASLGRAVEPLISAFGNLAAEIAQSVMPVIKLLADTLGGVVTFLHENIPSLREGGKRRLPSATEEPGDFLKALFAKMQGWTPEGVLGGLLGGDLEGGWRKALGLGDTGPGADEKKQGLAAAGAGFERPEELWRRLQTAVAKTGMTPEERTARATEDMREFLRRQARGMAIGADQDAATGARGLPGAGS